MHLLFFSMSFFSVSFFLLFSSVCVSSACLRVFVSVCPCVCVGQKGYLCVEMCIWMGVIYCYDVFFCLMLRHCLVDAGLTSCMLFLRFIAQPGFGVARQHFTCIGSIAMIWGIVIIHLLVLFARRFHYFFVRMECDICIMHFCLIKLTTSRVACHWMAKFASCIFWFGKFMWLLVFLINFCPICIFS